LVASGNSSRFKLTNVISDFISNLAGNGSIIPWAVVNGSDFAREIVPFPEPSTYSAILGAVGIGLVVWQKRRRRAAKTDALVANTPAAK